MKGRVNVVVSRSPHTLDLGLGLGKGDGDRSGRNGGDKSVGKGDVMAVGSVEEGLRMLLKRYPAVGEREGEEGDKEGGCALGRVFIIGGAQIYSQALQMSCCERILWTRVEWEGECDVFFPGGVLPLENRGERESEWEVEEGGIRGDFGKWVRRPTGEMERWVGEEAVGGWRREGGVEFEVCMLERVREGVD